MSEFLESDNEIQAANELKTNKNNNVVNNFESILSPPVLKLENIKAVLNKTKEASNFDFSILNSKDKIVEEGGYENEENKSYTDNSKFDYKKTSALEKINVNCSLYYNNNYIYKSMSPQKNSFSTSTKKSSFDISSHKISQNSSVSTMKTMSTINDSSNSLKVNSQIFYSTPVDYTGVRCSSSNSFEKNNEINNYYSAESEILTCPLCFKLIESNEKLINHFNLMHKEFVCHICNKNFEFKLELDEHLANNHLNDNQNNSLITTDYSINKLNRSHNAESNIEKVIDNEYNEISSLECPICQKKCKEQTLLEIHVESHFVNSNIDSALITGASLFSIIPRNQSQNSLTANVEEKFEYEQLLSTTDTIIKKTGANKSEKNNNCFLFNNDNNDDYEIALVLDEEEKEMFKKKINKSMRKSERLALRDHEHNVLETRHHKQTENIKSKLFEVNIKNPIVHNFDEDLAMDCDYQSDSEQIAQLEHEWLKEKYGMTDNKASTRAMHNLEKAFKTKKIDMITYERNKAEIENWVNANFDKGETCTKNLCQIISAISLTKIFTKRIVCKSVDLYSSSYIDSGYGCGYRNTQMLLSSIREDPRMRLVVFNMSNFNMPSVTKIQELIERAWNNGFDVLGKAQLGGYIKDTSKWIGASDVCAMFSSMRIKTELVDIYKSANNTISVSIGSLLFKFVKNYFEEESLKAINPDYHIHPIYLQHDGHSRTIIGYESGPKNENLLIFDPQTDKSQVEKLNKNISKGMSLFRRSIHAFNKKKEYQLLLIRGIMGSEDEFEKSKVLKSTKITS